MTKPKKDSLARMSAQQTIFDTQLSEGSLDVSMAFRASLTKVISKLPNSRWEISARISELTNRNISKDMLDKYTSSNLDYALRAEDLTAICQVTGSIEPVQVLLDPLGYEVISPADSDLVKLARLTQKRAEIEAQMAEIKRRRGMPA